MLTTIAKYLGTTVNLEENSSLSESYNQLEVKFIQSTEALENEKETRSFIREKLYHYEENLSKKEELDKTLTSENNAFKKIDDAFTIKKEVLNKQQVNFDQNGQEIIDIANALEELKIIYEKFNRLYETYKQPALEEENRLDGLSKYVASKRRKIADINERVILVEKCIELIPIWINTQDAIKGIVIEFGALQVSQSQSLSAPDGMIVRGRRRAICQS